MKNVIKTVAFIIIVLSISTIIGCSDFPDQYAVDASVGEIRMQDDAKLSEDGKSYTATILVDFDIRENTFSKLSSAIVNINGNEYDVVDQLDHKLGGMAEITCTFESNRTISVIATLKVATHSFGNEKRLQPKSFANDVKLSTGKADGITPCSAVLSVDANYPWFIMTNNFYMLVSSEQFNIPVDAKIDNFNGQVLRCTFKTGSDYDSYKIECPIKGLHANTSYYYQMVRLDSNSKAVAVGETKSFKTTEATAKINTSVASLTLTRAMINVTFDSGNLNGLYTSDWNVVWHIGESLEALEASSGSQLGFSKIIYPYTFTGLNATSKYYYRCDFYIGEGLMCSSGVKEFTTSESTASLDITKNELFDTYTKIGVTLVKGNTTGVISSSGSDYASVKLFLGESEDEMSLNQTISAYGYNAFNFYLKDLLENKKYYYKVCYYAGNSLLASSDVLEFTTYKSVDITNLGSLGISTSKNHSSGSRQFSINARKGSILAFDYSINQGSHSLTANLTGASDVSLFRAQSTSLNWETGSLYYVFTESGTYTLTLDYSAGYYATINVPEIKFIY